MTEAMFPDRLRRARELYNARDYAGVRAAYAHAPDAELLREPELAFVVADSLRRVGEAERALRLAQALDPVCRRRGNDRLGRDRWNLEGMLRFEQGDVAGASAAWQALHASAAEAGDDEFAARATQNLGVVQTLAGRMEDALASHSRALASYTRLGYRRGLAQAHHNLGIIYRELEFADEAERHFERAARYARADRSTDELARIGHERALIALQRGELEVAEAMAMRSHERFVALADPAEQGEALRVLGFVALRAGRHELARARLEQALSLATAARRTLLAGEVLEALAALARVDGAGAEAEGLSERADAAFQAMRAEPWGRLVRRRVAELVKGGAAA
jgi:tetratricopeptide (TPR) repeat protein